jgi:hypothetical protein
MYVLSLFRVLIAGKSMAALKLRFDYCIQRFLTKQVTVRLLVAMVWVFFVHHRVPFADVLKSSCDAKGTPLVDGNNRLSGFAQDVLGKCLSHALLFSPSCVFVYENGSPIVWISSEITCQLGMFLGSLRNTFQRYAHLVLHFQHNDSVDCQCTELTLAIDAA